MDNYTLEWVVKSLSAELERYKKTSRFFLSLRSKIENGEFDDSKLSQNELLSVLSPAFFLNSQITLEFLVIVLHMHFVGSSQKDRKTNYNLKYEAVKEHIFGVKANEILSIRKIGNAIKHTLTIEEKPYDPERINHIINKGFSETIKHLKKLR